jgi:glycosyltransferase involved in cell wall biosynthesis
VVCLSPLDDYSSRLVDELGAEWLPIVVDNKGSNPVRDLRLFAQLVRYYRALRPAAALHFTVKINVYGTWAARLNGVPAVNTVSGLGTTFIRSGAITRVVKLLYRTSQSLAYKVFCQNRDDMERLVSERLVASDKLELVPGSGVNVERFRPSHRERPASGFRFLYAGRMLADKGLNELVEAVSTLNREGAACDLWLYGFSDASNRSALSNTQLLEWSQLPFVSWYGPSDAMEEVYARVDCVVLPSYREGMPRTLLEASSMGLPVVATDVPGCRSFVRDGVNGLLCEPQSSVSLARAMRAVIEMSPEERQAMGKEGRAIVERDYNEKFVVEATLRAIEEAVLAA